MDTNIPIAQQAVTVGRVFYSFDEDTGKPRPLSELMRTIDELKVAAQGAVSRDWRMVSISHSVVPVHKNYFITLILLVERDL